jgi:hypothetical protein
MLVPAVTVVQTASALSFKNFTIRSRRAIIVLVDKQATLIPYGAVEQHARAFVFK